MQYNSANNRGATSGQLGGAEIDLRILATSDLHANLLAWDYHANRPCPQRGLARVQQFFVALNDRLAEREFVATDRFSVADITTVVAVDFARVVKVKPNEAHPHLVRWRTAMGQRAAVGL